MKKLLIFSLLLMVLVNFSWAQVWTWESDFAENTQPHGVVIDNAGKIWIGYYGVTDSVVKAGGTAYVKTAPIWIYDSATDTEPTKLNTFTLDGVADTLWDNCRGLSLDNNGNVLWVGNAKLIQFNYQTLAGMNKYIYPIAGSLTNGAVDENGYIFIGRVGAGGPLVILDEDFEVAGYVTDTLKTLQRSLLVSADGLDVYVPTIYSGVNGIRHFHGADGPGGDYVLVDTIGTVFNEDGTVANNMWGQAADWDANGLMWVGTYWDVGVHDFTGWYALDPTQDWAVVDTIGHSLGTFAAGGPVGGGAYYSPRHLAFSADGKTAFANDFDGGVTMIFTNADPKGPGSTPIPLAELVVLTGIKGDNGQNVIAFDFKLNRNFPNPFNPSTTIPFELNNGSMVKLTIYDMLGREVATLVKERLNAGMHSYKFDASGYATGTYIYCLEVNGQQVSKSMLYLK
ncbi:T9SS type A sorting domain-containing protein [bacterium]|nr:T9SS type A sorting domain-containing protein [bacterium]MBU1635636.1 T9SS type A sorting domain-containing protein [bacterium]MBU1874766.1 T9SS type A sorting domain-containing protein [bacterium]